MLRGDAVDHVLGLAATPDQFRADDGVRAFHFMINGLSDVVQQAGPLGSGDVQAEFRGHQSHQLRNFDGMIEDVLREAVPETQPAQQLDDFHLHRRQPQLEDRLFAAAQNGFVHFLRNFGHDFLDARGMDAPVENQPLHGFTGNLAPHGIEAGQDDRVGRVVDEHGNTGGGFEGPNVSSLSADDAPFDVVSLQRHRGRGGFERVLARVALDGEADNTAGLVFGLQFCLLQNVPRQIGGVVQRFLLGFL